MSYKATTLSPSLNSAKEVIEPSCFIKGYGRRKQEDMKSLDINSKTSDVTHHW